MLGPNQALWVHELENGGRKQGKSMLQFESGFCCLGIACEVLDSPDTRVIRQTIDDKIIGTTLIEQQSVLVALGLRNESGLPDETNPRSNDLVRFVKQIINYEQSALGFTVADCELTNLNDDVGLTFPQIASILRRFPELYFNGPR